MDTNSYPPIPTCEIPMPILEGTPEAGEGEVPVPRILLQVAGSSRAAWKVRLLLVLFLLIALLELILLLHFPLQEPLVVYGEFPRTTLLESLK